jgi:hypothetical protein
MMNKVDSIKLDSLLWLFGCLKDNALSISNSSQHIGTK